jgi:hypothetical protein
MKYNIIICIYIALFNGANLTQSACWDDNVIPVSAVQSVPGLKYTLAVVSRARNVYPLSTFAARETTTAKVFPRPVENRSGDSAGNIDG